MLFLYRPRQTWMPYRLPRRPRSRSATTGSCSNSSTRRAAYRRPMIGAPDPRPDTVTALKELAELHASGMIDDAEFAAAKAKVLDGDSATR